PVSTPGRGPGATLGRLGVDTGLLALLRRDRRRGVRERVDAATGLGEGDDVADRLRPGQQRTDAIPAEGDAAVWRGAVGERLEEEAELLLRLLLRDPHHAEDPFLDVLAVDTDRSPADLVAVADDVVGVRQRRPGVGVERVEVLRPGRGEGVVHGGPRAGTHRHVAGGGRLVGRLEQRRVDDPGERPRVRVDQSELVGDLAPCGAEQRTGRLHGTGPEEDAVARLRPHVRGDTGALLVREVLGHGPAELTVLTHED